MTWPRKQLEKPSARQVRKYTHNHYNLSPSFVNHDTSNDVISTTGVTAREVDVVELHDCFSTNELITYEASFIGDELL